MERVGKVLGDDVVVEVGLGGGGLVVSTEAKILWLVVGIGCWLF